MNKFLLIIIAVIIIGAIFVLGKNNSNQSTVQQSSQRSSPAAIAGIYLTSTGFTPKDITVKVGTTIIWVNRSGKKATINSDLHPTHLVYPRLNIGEIADGSALNLVFDKKGKYGYHDHSNPSVKGTVTVE